MSSKIANLCDIDLNFSEFISDVNGDNPEKVLMHRSCISKHRFFAILVCTFQTGPVMYIGFDFVLPYRYKHLVVQIDFHSFFLSWISRMVFFYIYNGTLQKSSHKHNSISSCLIFIICSFCEKQTMIFEICLYPTSLNVP